MSSPTFNFGIPNLRTNHLFDQYYNPYNQPLNIPGLMDSPQQSDNSFGELFQPNYNQPPSIEPSQMVQQQQIEPQESPNSMEEYINLMKQLNHPEHTASDRLNQLLNNFPQEQKPSFGRALLAAGAGFTGGIKGSQEVLDQPLKKNLENWKAQTTPAYQAAEVERQRNDAERTLTSNVISAKVAADRLKASEKEGERKRAAQEVIEARKADAVQKRNEILAYKTQHPDWKMDATGPTVIVFDPATGQPHDTKISTGNLSDLDKLHLQGQNAMNVQGLRNQGAANVAGIQGQTARDVGNERNTTNITIADKRGAGVFNGPDPNDPTKQVPYWVNPVTNSAEPVPGIQGPLTKPGTPNQGGENSQFTNTTRVMMEGAKMMLPSIPDIDNMAKELDKRGLFGPVMSRVRELAAKVGTTGSAQEVQKSLNEFADAVTNDPYLNDNTDALVGEFATRLGLMASGAGRVHGGARGGGSIQMINYMKGLFTSDSTLQMFQGRLKGLEKQLKDYAVGPGGAVITTPRDKYDDILDNALKGLK